MGNDAVGPGGLRPANAASMNNAFGAVSNEHGLFVGNSVNYGTLTQIGSQVINNYAGPDPDTRELEKRQKLTRWISPLDHWEEHRGLLNKVAPRTGQWFLNSEQFLRWKSRKTQYLWCSGKPGAGKSVLASIAIKDLQQSKRDCRVAFLYLSYKQKPSVNDLLGSLVNQLISTPLPRCIQDLWNDENEKPAPFGSRPDLTQLEELLSALTAASDTFIVVDAMDEFDLSQRQNLLNSLRRIKTANILVTSRDKAVRGFETAEIHARHEDIHGYIEQESGKLTYLTERDADLRTYIKRKVAEKAHGIFLMVRCHMEILASLDSCGRVPEALEKLPSNPDSMYTSALQRIYRQPGSKRGWAMSILGWMVHACRPLELDELRHALLMGGQIDEPMESGDVEFDHSYLISRDEILSFCCGLVEIENGNSDTLKLIHFTTQEFFEKRSSGCFPNFHARAAFACAKYLCIPRLEARGPDESAENPYTSRSLRDGPKNYTGELNEYGRLKEYHKGRLEMKFGTRIERFDEHAYIMDYTESPKDTDKIMLMPTMRYFNGSGVLKTLNARLKLWLYPFFTYAGKYLAHHFRNIADDANRAPVEDQLRRIWESAGKRCFHEWLLDAMVIRRRLELSTLTDYAAFFGSPRLIQHYGRNQSSHDLEKALKIAIDQGCSAVVKYLLTTGPMADLTRSDGHRLLLSAAQNGSLEAVNHVVASIVESLDRAKEYHRTKTMTRRTKDWFDGRPRLDTSEYDHFFPGISLIKLEHYVHLLSASVKGDAATLLRLSQEKRFDIFPFRYDVEIPPKSKPRKRLEFRAKALLTETAFFLSVENCHTQAVEVFLNNGIDIDAQDWEQQTPLHRAVHRNSKPLVELLLKRNAALDISAAGKSVWRFNTRPDRAEVMGLLLDTNADARSKALSQATLFEDLDLLKMSLEFGADPSMRDPYGFGQTPLHTASKFSCTEIVQILLEYGADFAVQDDEGCTALHLAARHVEGINCMELLLDAGANPNILSKEQKTAVDEADGYRKMVDLLIKHGGKMGAEL
ncbi:uncharacterized protein BKA78DRAFT_354013 [Phyllosticta capitalensis]|uniref:uncharacterized protein n=1 Tax=Phyllosticta capitalensis TaxID=121624 RepID=UPI00312FEC28